MPDLIPNIDNSNSPIIVDSSTLINFSAATASSGINLLNQLTASGRQVFITDTTINDTLKGLTGPRSNAFTNWLTNQNNNIIVIDTGVNSSPSFSTPEEVSIGVVLDSVLTNPNWSAPLE